MSLFKKTRLDIAGSQRRGNQLQTTTTSCEKNQGVLTCLFSVFLSGKPTQGKREAGVGFAVRKEIEAKLGEEPVLVNDRKIQSRR